MTWFFFSIGSHKAPSNRALKKAKHIIIIIIIHVFFMRQVRKATGGGSAR